MYKLLFPRPWVLVCVGIISGCSSSDQDNASSDQVESEVVDNTPGRNTLSFGEKLDIPQCPAWINGPPSTKSNESLLVIDLWGDWCPFCRRTAPLLRKTYEKYSEKGVEFISLTNYSEAIVTDYVKQYSLLWPHGAGLSVQQIKNLGVYNHEMNLVAGYEVKPTFYLVNSNGTVLWCDGHLRMRHKPPEVTIQALEEAIDKNLETRLPPQGNRTSDL
ncbi:MAG: thiol-disulfide isomerase/thioredoxin [Verrucomicrobiales bacterium]|jgi:thiol-disulfide isomerase/thioredoxin